MRIQTSRLTLLIAFVAVLVASDAPAQTAVDFEEVGRFLMTSFAPEDYEGHAQNWDVVQDEMGFLYVANGSGVLEYDGASWRLIRTANRGVARSLALGPAGRIFVGGVAEIGWLAPDALGRLRYVSLVEKIPEEDRAFSDVWDTVALSDGVYFLSEERLFRWRDGRIEVWRPETNFFHGFAVHGTFYATAGAGELYVLEGDELRLAPDGDHFAGLRTYALAPLGSDAFVALTRENGLVRCEVSGDCETYGPELTETLARIQPYSVALLAGEIMAIGTRRGGLVLIDRDARLIRILDESSGLRSNAVWAAHVDRQGGLWLALNDGLTRVEVTPTLSYFDESTGLAETINHVVRHHGRLYAATSRGVAVLDSPVGEGPRFDPVSGVSTFCWSMVSTDEGLLAGCEGGVYDIGRGQRILEIPLRSVYVLHRSKREPKHIYMGLVSGLARLTLDGGVWRAGGRYESIQEPVRSIAEDDQGRLWLGTRTEGVLRLGADAAPSGSSSGAGVGAARRFGVQDGLPVGWLETNRVAGQVRVMVDEEGTLFRFDAQTGRFSPDTTFAPEEARVKELTEDDQGRVWTVAGPMSIVAHPRAEGYDLKPSALRRVPNLQPSEIIAESNGPVWVANSRRLFRLDPEGSTEPEAGYPVWIRRVMASDGSILYDGPHQRPIEAPAWRFERNARRFAFAAPRFDGPEHTRYRTRLDGLENDWSEWTAETYKDYTNLWEGRYVFRVEARDVYGFVSGEDSFTFRVLPPWYRSWWALALYSLGLVLVVLVWRRSQREEIRRERATAERERAVSTKLREVDKLKDEFLANTSHELRTPLYGMTGLAESLIDGAAGELPGPAQAHLSLLAQSGRRLSALVDDILDFSKLENHSLELALAPVDLHALTDVVLTLDAPLAADKGLELINSVGTSLPPAQADSNRIQQVLHNLVGNAIKYTDSGQVEVSSSLNSGWLEVGVRDTGIGIAADQLENIFEPFFQTDGSIHRDRGGTGLGLAVSKQLVELHGGTLRAESDLSRGSVFFFTVPVASKAETSVAVEARRRESLPRSAPRVEPVFTESGDVTEMDVALARGESAASLSPGHETILVVDDEPIVRQVLENHLRSAGYRVLTAASGPEALELIGRESVDLVLLDIMMPKMSGYQVCRALREDHPVENLPILFLSAMNRSEDRTVGLDQGGNDYLSKPIAKSELLARVRTHLMVLEAHRRTEEEVVSLRGLLPICVRCKKIRDDEGLWNQIEAYISAHSEAEFSHGICPACVEKVYPGLLVPGRGQT